MFRPWEIEIDGWAPRERRRHACSFVPQVIETEGILIFPAEAAETYKLSPGELLALEPGPGSVTLEPYWNFLRDDWESISAPYRWPIVEEFLRRPVAAVEPGGRIAIPPEVFALHPGDRAVLQLMPRSTYMFYLFREGPVA